MIVDNGKYYIYRHTTLTDVVFYIGLAKKSKYDLLKNSYSRAYTKHGRSSLWQRTAKKYGYIVEILIETDDIEFLRQKEKEFIKLYGRKKFKEGTLVNFAEGGEKGGDGGKAKRKRVYMYDLNGNYLKSFNSIKNAANKFKLNDTTIIQCLKGKQKQTNGYQFKYYWSEKIDKVSYKIKVNTKIIHINLLSGAETLYNSPVEASEKLQIKIKKIYHNLKGESKIVEKIHKFKYLENE